MPRLIEKRISIPGQFALRGFAESVKVFEDTLLPWICNQSGELHIYAWTTAEAEGDFSHSGSAFC